MIILLHLSILNRSLLGCKILPMPLRSAIWRSSITARSSIDRTCHCWHLRRHSSLTSVASRQQGGLATECPSASISESFRDVQISPHTRTRATKSSHWCQYRIRATATTCWLALYKPTCLRLYSPSACWRNREHCLLINVKQWYTCHSSS